jgi:Xaa-Pro aminopeptidase
MSQLTHEKLDQAVALVQKHNLGAWITYVRETSTGPDPALPLICEAGFVWEAALMVFPNGKRVAIVGNYDADPLKVSGDWDVIPYVQGIGADFKRVIAENSGNEKIAVNFSVDDDKADGLTHGMFLQLQAMLEGTGRTLVSAEPVLLDLRGIKTATELAQIRDAVDETETIYASVPSWVKLGDSEISLFDKIQNLIDERGWGYGWDRHGNPIVNFGPDSMIGHGVPSANIHLAEGQILHIDLGVITQQYSSDIQRVWFVGDSVPEDVAKAFSAVSGAISAGAEVLKPGAKGWRVDQAARSYLVSQGYPEYLHALGHQVGRQAHDGGTLLGPRWERYGRKPEMRVQAGEVYTLELGYTVPGRGYLGLEEMVLVTDSGVEWLSHRPTEMPLLWK